MDDVQETGATSMRKSKRSKRTPAHLKNSVVPVAKKGCRNGNKRPTSQKDSRCHSESRRSDDSDSVVSNPMEESQEKSLGGAHCELNPPVVQNDHVTLAVLRSKPCSITSPANSTGEDSGTSASIEAGKGVASSAPSDSQTRTTGEVDIAIPALDVDIDSDTEVGGTETSSTISAVSPSTISKVSTAHEFVEACTKLCQIYNTHASTDKSLLKVARSIWNKPIRVEKGRIISMKTVLMKEMFSPDMHREAISNLRRVQVSLAKAVHIAVGKPLDESMTLITKVWEAMSVLHVSTGQGKSRRMARTFLFTYKLKSHNADIRRKVIEVAANIFRLPNNDSNHLTDSKNMLFVLLGKNCDDATNLEEIRNDCLDLMEVTKADNIFEYSNKIGIRQILLRQGSRSSETFVNNKEVVGSYFRFMLEVVRHLGLRNNNHVITEWSVADFDKEIPWRVEVMVLATLIVRVLYSTGDNNTSDLDYTSDSHSEPALSDITNTAQTSNGTAKSNQSKKTSKSCIVPKFTHQQWMTRLVPIITMIRAMWNSVDPVERNEKYPMRNDQLSNLFPRRKVAAKITKVSSDEEIRLANDAVESAMNQGLDLTDFDDLLSD